MSSKKESLQSYYDKLKEEVENADSSYYELNHKHMRLYIKESKRGLEQITKHFNVASSGIVKKRNNINILRKERTLYDHIFKTLEYQILGQEKRLYHLIEQSQHQETTIKENEQSLSNITDLVSKNKYEDFYKIIEEERRKYIHELQDLDSDVNKEPFVEKKQAPMFNFAKKLAVGNDLTMNKLTNKIKEEEDVFEIDQKIKFYEEIFAQFRLNTVDEDYDIIENYLTKGDALNEHLYEKFIEMENQYENLNKIFTGFTHTVEKQEEQTVSTAITKNQSLEDPEFKLHRSDESLKDLIVTLLECIQLYS